MPMEEKRINYAEAMRRKLEEEEHFKYHVKKQGESLVFQIPVGAKNTSWFDMKLRVGCGGDPKSGVIWPTTSEKSEKP